MLTQEVLRHQLALRVAESEAGLGQEPTVPVGQVDLGELASATEHTPNVAAVAVLRRFEPALFARSSLAFALAVDDKARDVWFRAFTRTIFLNGNPENIADRFPFSYLPPDRSSAWFGPAPARDRLGLQRLLKLFDFGVPPECSAEVAIDVPGASPTGQVVSVYMSTAGLGVGDYLVHLNHTLAEAALTGAVLPGDRLLINHVPTLSASQIGDYRRLRVQRDGHDPTRLRAYACVSQPSIVDNSRDIPKEKTNDDQRSRQGHSAERVA
jgi:hypothetical protein